MFTAGLPFTLQTFSLYAMLFCVPPRGAESLFSFSCAPSLQKDYPIRSTQLDFSIATNNNLLLDSFFREEPSCFPLFLKSFMEAKFSKERAHVLVIFCFPSVI